MVRRTFKSPTDVAADLVAQMARDVPADTVFSIESLEREMLAEFDRNTFDFDPDTDGRWDK